MCAALAMSGCAMSGECKLKPRLIPGEIVLPVPMTKADILAAIDGGQVSVDCPIPE